MGNLLEGLMFQPPQVEEKLLKNLVFFKNKFDIQLYGIYINRNKKQTILISHGNAENIYITLKWVERYFLPNVPDVNVFIYEYSGYTQEKYLDSVQLDITGKVVEVKKHLHYDFLGKEIVNYELEQQHKFFEKKLQKVSVTAFDQNEEAQILLQNKSMKIQPREMLLYADIEAAYSFLIQHQSLNPKNIILLGQSIGSGPTCYLASKYIVGGVILVTPFTSILRIVFNFNFDFYGDKFNNLQKIKDIFVPILLIHGTLDEIVPFSHSLALYQNLNVPYKPFWVEGMGHNNIYESGPLLWKHIRRYLKSLKKINGI